MDLQATAIAALINYGAPQAAQEEAAHNAREDKMRAILMSKRNAE